MADTSHHTAHTVGWARFAGMLLLIAGIFHGIAGLVSLYKDEVYLIGPNSLIILDFTGWGWLHIAIGLLLIAAAFSLMRGNIFGRFVGIITATLSAIANFAFLGAYPLWSFLIIALDVLIIYAILVQGTGAQAAHASDSQAAPVAKPPKR